MRDLRDFYSPHFSASINGHKFTVECPSAEDGIRLKLMVTNPDKIARDDDLTEINRLFKGDPIEESQFTLPTGGLWDELWAAGVTWDEAIHLGTTAFAYFAYGEAAAVVLWEGAGNLDPKVQDQIRERMKGLIS